jgi:hypothetical protein
LSYHNVAPPTRTTKTKKSGPWELPLAAPQIPASLGKV